MTNMDGPNSWSLGAASARVERGEAFEEFDFDPGWMNVPHAMEEGLGLA